MEMINATAITKRLRTGMEIHFGNWTLIILSVCRQKAIPTGIRKIHESRKESDQIKKASTMHERATSR